MKPPDKSEQLHWQPLEKTGLEKTKVEQPPATGSERCVTAVARGPARLARRRKVLEKDRATAQQLAGRLVQFI